MFAADSCLMVINVRRFCGRSRPFPPPRRCVLACVELSTIQFGDRLVRISRAGHLHEGNPARMARIAVRHERIRRTVQIREKYISRGGTNCSTNSSFQNASRDLFRLKGISRLQPHCVGAFWNNSNPIADPVCHQESSVTDFRRLYLLSREKVPGTTAR